MKGFVISWFFPPINSSEGLVTFKLLKRSNIHHDVFTQKNNKTWSYNSSEHKLEHSNIKTIFGKSTSFTDWEKDCVRYFERNSKKYDFIMSRSMPPESHKAALNIKRLYPEIKWVASFGDPIARSPYTRMNCDPVKHNITLYKILLLPFKLIFVALRTIRAILFKRGYVSYLLHKIIHIILNLHRNRTYKAADMLNKKLEDEIILNADCIIFNSTFQKDYMLDGYPDNIKQKGIIIPHTFDKALYPKNKQTIKMETSKKITFSFIGHLDNLRSPTSLLMALKKLKKLKPNNYSKIIVNFYGNIDDTSKLYILDNNLYDKIKINKPVDYSKSLEIMQNSNWCLSIDANLSRVINENIYFAAKISDYLGSGSNIFGISMLDGASADIIRETGGILSSHSVDEIFMYLNLIIESKTYAKPKNTERYDNRAVSKEYDKLIEKLLTE